MLAKLFDPDARLGHACALSISLAALAGVGCGGKVADVDAIDGGADGVALADSAVMVVDSAVAVDDTPPTFDAPPPEDTGSVPSVDGSPSSPECTACVKAKCPKEQSACASDSACLAVIKCVAECPDDTCRNACIDDEAKPGVKLADELFICVQDNCPTECGL